MSRPLPLVRAAATALCLAALVACPSRGGNPPWRGSTPGGGGGSGKPGPIFTPSGAPVAAYNSGSPAPPSTPLYAAIEAAVDDAAVTAGKPPLERDGRLYAAMRDLAGTLDAQSLPSYRAIQFALAHHGIIEPSPEVVIVVGDDRAPGSLAAALQEKLPAALARSDFRRLGLGHRDLGDHAVLVVVAMQESWLDTEPMPRELQLGRTARLRGELRTPFADPQIYVTGADGQVAKLPVARDGGRGFSVEIACAEPAGPRQVEVIGRGPQGISVLANFPVYCGEPAPRTLTLPTGAELDEKYADAAEAEQLIFAHLNNDRRAAGLPALAWDDRAAGIARGHSADMAANHFVAHVSPTTGNAGDRARAGGLTTSLILENVARAYSPAEAQRGFMESPGHRANVLSADATHVGIGVVLGEEVQGKRELYVTQLFFRVPPKLDPAAAKAGVRKTLVDFRQEKRVAELRVDEELERIAGSMASLLAAGHDRDDVQRGAEAKMDAMAGQYSAIVTVVLVVGDAEQAKTEALADAGARFYGLGVAQGKHPQLGDGALYVVVLLARPR